MSAAMSWEDIPVTTAVYTPSRLAIYQGNPLVEALPTEFDKSAIWDRLYYMPTTNRDEIRELSDEERRLRIDELLNAHIPSPTTFDLYPRIRRALIQGYQFRNPLNIAVQQALFELGGPVSKPRPWNRTSVPSLLYMAPSGKGKSTVVRNILQLLPDVIEHTRYADHQFYLKQPLFLVVDCPSNGSKKTLFDRIFSQLDVKLGTNYSEEFQRKRLNIATMQKDLSRICAQHYVGMIIVDELHNLRIESGKGVSPNADVATLAFLDELFNNVGIPVLLIGTWRCARLLTQSMETVRRAGNHGRMTEHPYALENEYWNLLIEQLWKFQLCRKQTQLTPKISEFIHFSSGGLPALAVQLLVASQQLAIDSEYEKLDLRILKRVYETEFLPLHNALHQLRSGNPAGYEDLVPPRDALAGCDQWIADEFVVPGENKGAGARA